MSQVKKILIIGSSAYKTSDSEVRIDCYSWRKVGQIKNPRDYHTLIIDLLSISDEKSRSQVPWDEVHLKLSIYTSTQITKRGGQIVLIGDPRFRIPAPKESPARHSNINIPFLKWTGLKFGWDNSPGDTTYAVSDNSKYEQYLKRLSQWHYSLTDVVMDESIMGQCVDFEELNQKGITVSLLTTKLCRNLSKYALAFTVLLEYYMEEATVRGTKKKSVYRGGPIIFLPRINATEEETVEIVLRDVCRVEILTPEPEWVRHYVAPGQKLIDQRIDKRQKAILKEKKSLKKDEDKRIEARERLKLLYVGETELEPVVWNILEKLGANVEKPKNPGKEDGWVSVEIGDAKYKGVLEIESTTKNQFNEKGIEQLAKWKDRGIRLRHEKYKGIFIGNSCRNEPPEGRPCPFADDWRKTANISEICVLMTADLYRLYELQWCGKFDVNTFWSDVFQTDGVFPIEKYFSGTMPKGDYSS